MGRVLLGDYGNCWINTLPALTCTVETIPRVS